MKTAIAILALALLDVITIMILRHESNKRKDAEKKALEAAHNVKVLTGAQKIKEEARSETDKKIFSIRCMGRSTTNNAKMDSGTASTQARKKVLSSNSDRDKFNHIVDELSKLSPDNPFAS